MSSRSCIRQFAVATMSAATWILAGCGQATPRPADAAATSRPATFSYADYSLALRRCVRNDGVDYAVLAADRRPLARFLSQSATLGPRCTPPLFSGQPERTAYYLNVYNAAVLNASAEQARSGGAFGPMWTDPAYSLVRVDGRLQLVRSLRAAALATAEGDWRVELALCGGRRGDPPLARRPYLPDLLDAQLRTQVLDCLERPSIVTIDHGLQRLLLGDALYDLKSRLVDDYERRTGAKDASVLNVLLELSPPDRRFVFNSAIGYDVERLPYDRRPNSAGPMPPQNADMLSQFRSLFSALGR